MLKSVFFVIFLQEMTTIVVVGKLLFCSVTSVSFVQLLVLSRI